MPSEEALERARQLAADFCTKFDGIKVTSTGSKGGAFAAHHNKETGWGFTANFVVDADGNVHLHTWVEFVGKAEDADRAAAEIEKIVGGKASRLRIVNCLK